MPAVWLKLQNDRKDITMSEENKNLNNTPEADGDVGESNAAKRLRMLGISTEDPAASEPIAKTNFFVNFWYHYKWHTIVAAFLIAVFAIGIGQMATKVTPDIYIMYAGPYYYQNTTSLMGAFKATMPEDYNEDGEKIVNILQAVYKTEEQIEAEKAEQDQLAAENKDGASFEFSFDYGFNTQEYDKFRNEILIGESIICILDPALYEEVKGDDLLLTLEEALGYEPDFANDEYSIRFKDLAFAKKYKVFEYLPEDSLLVIRRVTAMSSLKGKTAERRHENHVDYFKAMVEFKKPFKDVEE